MGQGFQRLLNFRTIQPGAPEKIYIFFCHTRILKKISENKKQCETLIKHRDFEKNAVKMRSNEKSAPFLEAAKRQKKNRKPFIQAVSGAPAKSRCDRI